MIPHSDILEILKEYDLQKIHVGVLGGHSALDVACGAKKYGFKSVAVCQKGREKTYDKYFKTHSKKGCIDEVILIDNFKDIVAEDVQRQLRELNTVFVHSRYFWVYCDFEHIENIFKVPILGTRSLVKLEERDRPGNQYELLQEAGIRMPRIFKSPKEIDSLALVKVNEAQRNYERAFFFAQNQAHYHERAEQLISQGKITKEALDSAVIEEFVIGAQVNFNYFYSPLNKALELMGTDMRRQTNLDGLLRLPANHQLEALEFVSPKLIETGHVACTIKESLLEKIFEIGEKFVKITQRKHAPGIIGPFALQGAVTAEQGKEDIVIFDVSMRIPGSPGTRFTPYSGYLYGENLSYGERIGIELKEALAKERLSDILT